MAARPLPRPLVPSSRTHQDHRAAHYLRHALPQLGRGARLTQRPGELPSLRRGGEQRQLRHPRGRRACSRGPAWPRRRQVRPRRPARPSARGSQRRRLPASPAASPGGAAPAAPSEPCHAPKRPSRRPQSPASGAAPGLARGNRACVGGVSPMPPASLRGRLPGRLLGAGCPARRGAGRREEGPARRDRRPRGAVRPARRCAGVRQLGADCTPRRAPAGQGLLGGASSLRPDAPLAARPMTQGEGRARRRESVQPGAGEGRRLGTGAGTLGLWVPCP